LTVIRRRDLGRVVELAKGFDPKVFYSVDELKEAAEGVAPRRGLHGLFPGLARPAPAADLLADVPLTRKAPSREVARRVRA
jgi:hypothetical protein